MRRRPTAAGLSYDAAKRLANVGRSGDPQSFLWDEVGNRETSSRNGVGVIYTKHPARHRMAHSRGVTGENVWRRS